MSVGTRPAVSRKVLHDRHDSPGAETLHRCHAVLGHDARIVTEGPVADAFACPDIDHGGEVHREAELDHLASVIGCLLADLGRRFLCLGRCRRQPPDDPSEPLHTAALLIHSNDQRDASGEVLQLRNAAPHVLCHRTQQQDPADAPVSRFLHRKAQRALAQRRHDGLPDPDPHGQFRSAPAVHLGPPRSRQQLSNGDARQPADGTLLAGQHRRTGITHRDLRAVGQLQPHSKCPGGPEPCSDDVGMDLGRFADDRQDGCADRLDGPVDADHPVAHAAGTAEHCRNPRRIGCPVGAAALRSGGHRDQWPRIGVPGRLGCR